MISAGMVKFLALVLAASLLCATAPAQAKSHTPQEPTAVTLDAKDLDVRDAIRAVFAKSNASFVLDPNVQGKINMSLKNVSFETALQEVLRQAGATYTMRGDIYQITPRIELGGDPAPVDMELKDALRRISGNVDVVVSPGVTGQVTIVGNQSDEETLATIARQLDARVVKTETGFRLEPKNSLRKPVAVVRATDGDLRKIVTELMASAGVGYVVSSGVAGKVTVNLSDTDVQSAVEALLAPIGGKITLRRGVFIVSVR